MGIASSRNSQDSTPSGLDEQIQEAIASGKKPVFLFWENMSGEEMPRTVEACITRIRERAGDQFRVFVVDRSAAPAPPRGWGRGWGSDPRHKIAHIKDYVSFYLMATYGGVWLDASIVLLKPLDQVFDFDLESGKFQGWYAPGSDGGKAENWAWYAPRDCPVMKLWYEATMRYLENNDNISEYLWQHEIWENEIAPALARQNLNDKCVLRNPFGILACPAYAPYACQEKNKAKPLLMLKESDFQQPFIKLTSSERKFVEEQLRACLFVTGSLLHLLVCPDDTGLLAPPNRKWYWLRDEEGNVIESGKGAGLVSDDYYYKWALRSVVKQGRLHTAKSGGPSIRAVALAVLGKPRDPNMVAFYAGDREGDLSVEHLEWRPRGHWNVGLTYTQRSNLWKDSAAPGATWKPLVNPNTGKVVRGYSASSCGAIRRPDGKIDRGTPQTGKQLGVFTMKFPFGDFGQMTQMHVHVVTCASFHGVRDRTLWCVDHIENRLQNRDKPYPGRADNLRWLPISNELAEEVGLPTNSGRADESETQSSRKRRASKTGITYWFREVGATDEDGWTEVRSMKLFFWLLNGEKHPGKEVRQRMQRELDEVVESADSGAATERKSIPRHDGVRFEVTRNEPSNVAGEYAPENYYGGNSSSDKESDGLEEQPAKRRRL